jgi:hypothetical protein
LTYTVPSVAGKIFGTNAGTDYLEVRFGMSCGASNNANYGGIGQQSAVFVLWGVQLEIGSVATPLEKPDPRYDLSNCQRFCQLVDCNSLMYNGAGQGVGYTVAFNTTMRAAPTATVSGVVLTNATGFTGSATPRSLFIQWTVTATGTSQVAGSVLMSADL